jgi:adenine deaminase
MVNDNMGLYLLVNERIFLEMIEEMGTWPVKMLWSARLDPQTHAEEFRPFFQPEVMRRLLAHPFVMQAGELTAWPQLLAGEPEMVANMLETMRIGKRIEGHLPGASLETLSMLAAGGVTAEHEAMNSDEVIRRLRIGLWTTLRYSSLRPDLPDIVRGLADYKGDTKRLMMTTDGSTPAFLEDGYTDHMLRVAMAAGVDPMTAYQMVTINPATYYGLDGEIGGIAPGRLADILVLESLRQPTPLRVMAEGNWAAQDGQLLTDWPRLDWEAYGLRKLQADWRVSEADFVGGTDNPADLPIIRLENPAITRDGSDGGLTPQAGETADNLLIAALFDRSGQTVVEARLEGMAERLAGLASSYTASKGILVIGQQRAAMAHAANRVLEMGGGIVLVEDGKLLYEMELPVVGGMAVSDMKGIIDQVKTFERLLRERGHHHYDPIYTLLFLTSTHLPEIRLTPEGVLHVKSGRMVREPRILAKQGRILPKTGRKG